MEAHVTPQSQSYRLRQRAEEAQIHHGQEVRADVPNVRVMASAGTPFGWLRRKAGAADTHSEVFFCNIGPIRIREVLANGDDQPLPADVIVEGLDVAESGFYDLVNVLIRSNGDIRLVLDEKTSIKPQDRESALHYL
jgi:hypothetical protein